MMEIDVFVTKDGVAVLNHDTSLKRLTGVDEDFTDYNFADLPPIKQQVFHDFMPDSYEQTEFDDGQWLKLSTFFEAMPKDMYYFIEIKKTSGSKSAEILHRVIKEHGVKGRVIWGCFDHDEYEQ